MEKTEIKAHGGEHAYIRQIMTDMKNGVMALDKKGRILYANPQMTSFFEKESLMNDTVHSLMYAQENAANDGFWDALLDVIHGHAIHYQKKVKYIAPSGRKYCFHVTSSYLCGQADGVVITVADETEYDNLVQKKHDATIVLIGILMLVCMTVLCTELYVFLNGAFPHAWIARFTEITGFVIILFFLKATSLTVKDFGIIPVNLKKELTESFIVVAVMVLGMSAGKAVMLAAGSALFPENAPFFDFTAPPGNYYLTYIAITFMQELMTKCGLQKSISKILDGRYSELVSILATSMMFMTIHVQHGLIYMVGAGVLSAVLAILYSRHNSLLGCCIVHYTFGIMGLVLQWIR